MKKNPFLLCFALCALTACSPVNDLLYAGGFIDPMEGILSGWTLDPQLEWSAVFDLLSQTVATFVLDKTDDSGTISYSEQVLPPDLLDEIKAVEHGKAFRYAVNPFWDEYTRLTIRANLGDPLMYRSISLCSRSDIIHVRREFQNGQHYSHYADYPCDGNQIKEIIAKTADYVTVNLLSAGE
jgi:hypothetical protein